MEGIKINLVELARQVNKSFEEHKQVWKIHSGKSFKDATWIPPPSNWTKLNFDTAIRDDKTYVVVVGRDQGGKLVAAWPKQLSPCSPLFGEAKSALVAIQRATTTGCKNVVIEGDA